MARGFSIEAIFVGAADHAVNVSRVPASALSGEGHAIPAGTRQRWRTSRENALAYAERLARLTQIDFGRDGVFEQAAVVGPHRGPHLTPRWGRRILSIWIRDTGTGG